MTILESDLIKTFDGKPFAAYLPVEHHTPKLGPRILPANHPDVALEGVLRVLEIYPAYQGEGVLTGMPSLFVRFAGCTVGCQYCDTKFSWKAAQGDLYTPKQLASVVNSWKFPHIVITGGEPDRKSVV